MVVRAWCHGGALVVVVNRVARETSSSYKEIMPFASRRRVVRIALASAMVLVTGAGENGAEPRRDVRIGVPSVPGALDPATALSGTVPLIARNVFETLVAYREGSTDIEPALATRWTVSRDGLVWSFTIRDNAVFHDGTVLTAHEVLQSFERQLLPTAVAHPNPNAVWPALLRGMPGVVKELAAPDPRTFRMTLVQPYAPLLTVLAHPGFSVVRVSSGLDGQSRLVGSGTFRVAETGPGRLVLEAAAVVPGRQIERLEFSEVASEDQADAALAAHALDLWFPAEPPKREDGALSVPSTRVGLLAIQTEREPFSRRKVRQALATAIDPALLAISLDRAAIPLQSFLPVGVWGRRDGAPLIGGDRDAVRKLLAAGAWPRGFTPKLLAAGEAGPLRGTKVAESLAASLSAVNVPLIVRVESAAKVRSLTQAGDYELALLEASVEGGDPHLVLYPLSASEGALRGPTATNVAFYRNQRLDDLLIRASQIAFRPERERLYARAQALLAEELPWIPLYVRLHWVVIRPEVGGLRLHPTGFHRLDRLTLEPISP